MRAAPSEHGYARPVEGLIVTFDLDAMKVTDVEDHGVVPLPPTAGNYSEQFTFDPNNRPAFTEFRSDVKPIEITQPDGPSFTVDGWQVTWQKWALRIGFNPREGITLHEVTYTDRAIPGRSCTGRHCRRWWCPTATAHRRTGTRTSSTWVRSAWGSPRIL